MHALARLTILVTLAACGRSPAPAKPPEFTRMEERVRALELQVAELRGVDPPSLDGGAVEPKSGKARISKGKGTTEKNDIKRKKGASRAVDPNDIETIGTKVNTAGFAQVALTGDVKQVHLLLQRKKVAIPGKVASGSYTIVAMFEQGKPVPAGSVTVEAGQKVEINCDRAAKTCTGT